MSNTRTRSEFKAQTMTPEQIAESEEWAKAESERLDNIELLERAAAPLLHIRSPAVHNENAQKVVREFQEKFGVNSDTVPVMRTPRELFIAAIRQRRYLEVGYIPTSGGDARLTIVAPLDFGPSRKALDKADRYHMWDLKRGHVLSIKPEQLLVLNAVSEPDNTTFDPETIVTWSTKKSPWFIAREWGNKS